MYSEQEKDIESKIIFHENYREGNPGNYNANLMQCNTTYIPGQHLINARTINSGLTGNSVKSEHEFSKNRNAQEQNYHHSYLKCSKSEEYEFKFGKYNNDNFVSGGYTNKQENERMTFESLKIENLSSNISITVNYENRQENLPYSEKCIKARNDCASYKQQHPFKNIKIQENICCTDLKHEKELNASIDNKNIFKHDLQEQMRSTNNKIISPAFTTHVDGNIRISNISNNLIAIKNDNINDKKNINYNTKNNINNNKYNINNFCNDRNRNINYNDNNNNNNGYNMNKIKRKKSDALCNGSPIIKNENLVEYHLPCKMNIATAPQQYRNSDSEAISINQNISNACFNTLHAKYPDISFNLPDCKVQKITHFKENPTRVNLDDHINKQFLPLTDDNALVTISPKVIKTETNHLPQNFELIPEINTGYGNKVIPKSKLKEPQENLKICSNIVRPNPNFCHSSSQLISKNQYEVSSSFPYYKDNSDGCQVYDVCSSNCYSEQQKCDSFFGNNRNIGNVKSDFENNAEIKPHIINKRFSTTCKKLDNISTSTNSSKFNAKFKEQLQNNTHYLNTDHYNKLNSNYNVIIDNNLRHLSPKYTINQESNEYKEHHGGIAPNLLMASSPSSTTSSHVTYSKHNNISDINKNTNAEQMHVPHSSEINTNSNQIFVPAVINSNQNSSKSTTRWNEDQTAAAFNRRNSSNKHNETNPRNSSKTLKRSEKMTDSPNYRELLNKAHALKNTISEKDLNMEIIRRTLKCDFPLNQSYNNANCPQNYKMYNEFDSTKPRNAASLYSLQEQKYNLSNVINPNNSTLLQMKTKHSNKNKIVGPTSFPPKRKNDRQVPKAPLITPFDQHQIPVRNSNHCPLDLSVKTVKNIADSTGGNDFTGSHNSRANHFSMLPKIDFHPNFSIASVSQNIKPEKSDLLDLSEQSFIRSNHEVFCKTLNEDHKVDVASTNTTVVNKSTNQSMQNNQLPSKNTSCKSMLNSIDRSAMDCVDFSKIVHVDKAVDLTSRNKIIKTENRNGLKIIHQSQYQDKNYNGQTSVISQVPKKEFHEFEPFLNKELPNLAAVKIESNSAENIQLELEANLDRKSIINMPLQTKDFETFHSDKNLHSNKISQLNHYVEEPSEKKYLFREDNVEKNILITEDMVLKTEEINGDLRENKSDTDISRIRTKAELKGFDLSMLQSNQNISTQKQVPSQSKVNINQSTAELANENELNLMDWNTKCNDFVTQLVCNSNKKQEKSNQLELTVKHKKDFLNGNYKSNSKDKNKKKSINNRSSSSSDEDKPLNELCQQNSKNFFSSYNEGKINNKTENCANESNTQNSRRKTENNFKNKLCRKYKQLIIEKIEREIDLEKDEQTSKEVSVIKSGLSINTQNCKTPPAEKPCKVVDHADSNEIELFEIKTRKRKFIDFAGTVSSTPKTEQTENSSLLENRNCKKPNVMTKAEMKFQPKLKEISTKPTRVSSSSATSTSENKKHIVSPTTPKKHEKSAQFDCDKKSSSFDKNSNNKINLLNNKEVRTKKRKMFLRNMEYNRILRNKRMITRGNLKKSLSTSTNKNLLRETKKSKNTTVSKKLTDIKSKKNQKPITRASSKTMSSSSSAKNCDKKHDIKDIKSYKSDNNLSQNTKEKLSNNKSNFSKFPPGWEHEVFEYKRSLKIPLRLITIKGGTEYNSLSMSQDKNSSPTAFDKIKNYEDDQSNNSNSQISSKSIIDILHSRAINLGKESKGKPKSSSTFNKAKSEKNYFNKLSNTNSKKSNVNHFSVFDTEILKARTRTESRMLKTKEHIREIFVGEDRPASAPPEMPALKIKNETNKSSFEEKFKQYLEEINADFGVKIRKINNNSNVTSKKLSETNLSKVNIVNDQNLKIVNNEECSQQSEISKTNKINEEDVEEEYVVPDSLKFDQICSVRSKIYKQKRPNKYRKKGSSGFDYIKKKKKLTTTTSTTKPTNFFIRKKMFPKFFGKKTENDVCKEIKNWVINKSLGQSYLHKAARLGYLDVIAYCLEKLNMNPNPKDNAGYTPLHEACQRGRIDIARLLLQYGANHSQAALSGIRPLHEASESGYIEIIRLLVSYGADPLLTTYAGQTPLMLADSDEIEKFILHHIDDIQNTSPLRKPWTLSGPWKKIDLNEIGYNELEDAPGSSFDHLQKLKNFNSLSRNLKLKLMETVNMNIDKNCNKSPTIRELVTNQFGINDMEDHFECEESDMPLPPLYILKDEGSDKWLLLNDLCHILKIKSKETLLKQIVSSASSTIGTKEIMRELKVTDFIEKATCLQLLSAGEKLNIQASKVVLIKYNDQVKSLLGVEKTILNF